MPIKKTANGEGGSMAHLSTTPHTNTQTLVRFGYMYTTHAGVCLILYYYLLPIKYIYARGMIGHDRKDPHEREIHNPEAFGPWHTTTRRRLVSSPPRSRTISHDVLPPRCISHTAACLFYPVIIMPVLEKLPTFFFGN